MTRKADSTRFHNVMTSYGTVTDRVTFHWVSSSDHIAPMSHPSGRLISSTRSDRLDSRAPQASLKDQSRASYIPPNISGFICHNEHHLLCTSDSPALKGRLAAISSSSQKPGSLIHPMSNPSWSNASSFLLATISPNFLD